MRRAWHAFVGFYWGEGIADDVPALTYFLMLSLAPFALGVGAVAAVVLRSEVSEQQIADEIARFAPADVSASLTRLVVSFDANSWELVIVAVLAMLWTSSGAIGILERCLSRMLERRRHPIALGRLRNIAIGALFALLIIFGGVAGATTSEVIDFIGLNPDDVRPFVVAGNALGSIVVVALILHWTPVGRLHWRASFAGGVLTGLGLQAMPPLIRFYVDVVAGVAPERVFFLLAAILFTFYLMALIVLFGTGIAAVVERRLEAGMTHERRSLTWRAHQALRGALRRRRARPSTPAAGPPTPSGGEPEGG